MRSSRGHITESIPKRVTPRGERIEAWQRLVRDLPLDRLERITQTVPLSALPQMAPQILQGAVRGRTVVDVVG